jgi:hypothetical protein
MASCTGQAKRVAKYSFIFIYFLLLELALYITKIISNYLERETRASDAKFPLPLKHFTLSTIHGSSFHISVDGREDSFLPRFI